MDLSNLDPLQVQSVVIGALSNPGKDLDMKWVESEKAPTINLLSAIRPVIQSVQHAKQQTET